jgi:hypothetical protein
VGFLTLPANIRIGTKFSFSINAPAFETIATVKMSYSANEKIQNFLKYVLMKVLKMNFERFFFLDSMRNCAS